MIVDSKTISPEDGQRKLAEAMNYLAETATTRGIQSLVMLVVSPDEKGNIEERMFSIFDLEEDEPSIAVLERWCAQARRTIALYKSKPGGSA